MEPWARETKRIVIVMPSWVGDSVMATPVLRAFRQVFPQAFLGVIVRPGLDELLAGCPWLDTLQVCQMKGLRGMFRLKQTIAHTEPDAVLLLPNTFRTALASRLAHVPLRAGYARETRGWLLTHRLPVVPSALPTSTVSYYLHLARAITGEEKVDSTLELFVTPEEEAKAQEILHDVTGPFVLLNPGGNKPAKRWPAAYFARVAETLAESHNLIAVVSGSPGEAELLSSIVATAGPETRIVNLVDRGVSLGSLKAIVKRAALMITNDTGPRHMAAALGTPVVTLFGPTDHRFTTLEGVQERCLLAEPFLREELVADRNPKLCRVERISVDDVIFSARQLLSASTFQASSDE